MSRPVMATLNRWPLAQHYSIREKRSEDRRHMRLVVLAQKMAALTVTPGGADLPCRVNVLDPPLGPSSRR